MMDQDLRDKQFNDLFDQLTNLAMYYDEYEIAINMRKAQIGMKCLFDELDEDCIKINKNEFLKFIKNLRRV